VAGGKMRGGGGRGPPPSPHPGLASWPTPGFCYLSVMIYEGVKEEWTTTLLLTELSYQIKNPFFSGNRCILKTRL
jgi:hypothetical protein